MRTDITCLHFSYYSDFTQAGTASATGTGSLRRRASDPRAAGGTAGALPRQHQGSALPLALAMPLLVALSSSEYELEPRLMWLCLNASTSS
jgi:hypothetical protein